MISWLVSVRLTRLFFSTEYDSTTTVPSCPLYIAPDFAPARIFLRVSALAFELLFAVSLDAVPMRVRVKFFVLTITLGNLVRLEIWACEHACMKCFAHGDFGRSCACVCFASHTDGLIDAVAIVC